MIINSTSDVKVLSEGQAQETIGMQLDLDSAHILMTMLSKNLYSDSIGSTIRETASNALDSHRRAGSDKPIIVSFGKNAQNNYEFCVEDFGTGLDDKDVENIISKYGKSTKRQSNTELGCFGLGFKAPLSYTSSFIFVCRKDSIERKYMMCEGEDGNTIELVFECVTPEENGVKIIVPVEYKDQYNFKHKIKQQLAYFENVYFEVEDIRNDFSILRDVDYQVSDLTEDKNMHICLDNVYYPIDWSKLGISDIPIGIGLRFDLSDGLFPTPSRENLIYSGNTKDVIMAKIRKVAESLVTKYNEDMKEANNVREIFNYYQYDNKFLKINNYQFSLNPILKYTDIKIKRPTLDGVQNLDLKWLYSTKDNLTKEYKVTHRISNGSINHIKHQGYSGQLKESNFPMKNIYVYSEEISHIKKEYLKSIVPYGENFLVKKIFDYKLKTRNLGYESLYAILDLKNHPKSNWRQVIKEFKAIQKTYTDQFINVDLIEPTQEWLDSRKKKRVYIHADRRVKLTGEICCKLAKHLQRSNKDRNCKFEPSIIQLENLHKNPHVYIYAKHDDYLVLDRIFNADATTWDYTKTKKKERLILFTVAPSEYKKLESLDVHNLISYEKFMEGNNKPYRRIITAQLVRKLMSNNSKLFDNLDVIQPLSKSLYDKLIKLQEYKKENYYSIDSEVFKAMLEVATEKDLFDYEIYSEYKEMETILEKFKFLDILLGKFNKHGTDRDNLNTLLIELFKYHKFKLDLVHYAKPVVVEDISFHVDIELDEITV